MEHGIFGGYEGMKWIASHLNLFELLNLQLGMESGLLFLFLFLSLFFKKITPLSLSDMIWILWSFEWEAFVEWTVVLRLWGSMAGKSGCQYPEWVTDRSDMFGLANGEFMWEMKTYRWQVPFPKWMQHSTKLKVTSDSSKRFMQYKALDGSF